MQNASTQTMTARFHFIGAVTFALVLVRVAGTQGRTVERTVES